MRYLTKSRFSTASTCPRKLAYLDDPTFANEKEENDFLEALAEGGHQVGALAKCLFPNGIEVDAIGHEAQLEQTNTLLAQTDVDIFEAAVCVGKLFIRADVLSKRGNDIALYEVKAKSYDSTEGESQILLKRGGVSSTFKPYMYDVLFQRHVLKLAFPAALITTHLILPDKSAACPESGLASRLRIERVGSRGVRVHIDESLRDGVLAKILLHVLPVDGYLDQLQREPLKAGGYEWPFEDSISKFETLLDGPTIEPRLGSHCRKCEFTASVSNLQSGLRSGRTTCWSDRSGLKDAEFNVGTVFDLYDFRSTDTVLAAGKMLLPQLEPSDVKLKIEAEKISGSHRQWLQCEESRDALRGPFLIADTLRAVLARAEYPLHFIDFETSTPALPFHAGRKPYEQLLFQFSHHRLDADGSLKHVGEYLHTKLGEFPNFATLRALAESLRADTGTVIHWWSHERTVLKKIREQLIAASAPEADRDELIAFIDSLIGTDTAPGRLLDLGLEAARPLVFLPGTKGSSSIKRVLPALLYSSHALQTQFGAASYGAQGGIPSKNFTDHAWVQFNSTGQIVDPYELLEGRFGDPDLDALDGADEDAFAVADGGAAMVAYGMLQADLLSSTARQSLELQLLRYCELDTLAMVMTWLGLREQLELVTGP